MFRKRRGDMNHALLMLRPIEAQSQLICKLYDTLAEPGHIAVAEYTPNTLNKPILAAIALYVLAR